MKLGKERADTPRESRETKRIRMARRGWRAGGAVMKGGSADGAAPPETGCRLQAADEFQGVAQVSVPV